MIMPNKLQADGFNEQIIIAYMIHDPEFRARMLGELSAETFLIPKNQIVFMVFEKLHEKGLDYNEDTFIVESEGMAVQEKLPAYMREIETLYDVNENIEHHIGRLKSDYVRKNVLIDDIPKLETKLLDNEIGLDEVTGILDTINEKIRDSSDASEYVFAGDSLYKSYMELMNERRTQKFYGTYFPEFDKKLTCGFAPAQVTVVAGLSGSGKTTFVANLASRLVHHNIPVLLFPLEEGGLRVFDRMLALKLNIKTMKLKKNLGQLTNREKYDLAVGTKAFSKMPLTIYNRPMLNFSLMEFMVDKYKPAVIVLDLFEKLAEVRGDTDQKNIAVNLNRFQNFVQSKNIHGIITAQIRRTNMSKANKRPTLDSIKNSGGYTEIADLVIGLHREAYFSEDDIEDIIEIICLKQRDGVAPYTQAYKFYKETSFVGEHMIVDSTH